MNHNVLLAFLLRVTDGVATGIWSSSTLSNYISILGGGGTDSSELVGFAQAIQGTALALVALPAGWFAGKIRRDSLLKCAGVVALMAIGLMTTALLIQNNKYVWLCVAVGLWGTALASSPILESLVADSTPTGQRSKLYTMMYIASILSQGLGPGVAAMVSFLNGNVWELSLLQRVMLVGMVVALLPACILFCFDDDRTLGTESEGVLGQEAVAGNAAAGSSHEESTVVDNTPHEGSHSAAGELNAHAIDVVSSEPSDELAAPVLAAPEEADFMTASELSLQHVGADSPHAPAQQDAAMPNGEPHAPAQQDDASTNGEDDSMGAHRQPNGLASQDGITDVPGKSDSQSGAGGSAQLASAAAPWLAGDTSMLPLSRRALEPARSALRPLPPAEERVPLLHKSSSALSIPESEGGGPVACGCLTRRSIPALLAVSDCIMGLASGMTIKFFPNFFKDEVQLSPVGVGILYCSLPIALTLASLYAQRLSLYIGRVQTQLMNKCIGIGLLYWMWLHPAIWRMPGLIVPVYIVRTAIMNCNYPLQKSILMDYVSKATRARWNSLESVTAFGWSGSAALGGVLLHRYGYGATFSITATMQLAALLLLLPLLKLVPVREAAVVEGTAAAAQVARVAVRKGRRGMPGRDLEEPLLDGASHNEGRSNGADEPGDR